MKFNTNKIFSPNVINYLNKDLMKNLREHYSCITFSKKDYDTAKLEKGFLTSYDQSAYKYKNVLTESVIYFKNKKPLLYITPWLVVAKNFDILECHRVYKRYDFCYSNIFIESLTNILKRYVHGYVKNTEPKKFKSDRQIYKNFGGSLFILNALFKTKVKSQNYRKKLWFNYELINFRRKMFTGFKGRYTLRDIKEKVCDFIYVNSGYRSSIPITDSKLKRELIKLGSTVQLKREKYNKKTFTFYTDKHANYAVEKYRDIALKYNEFYKVAGHEEVKKLI